MNRIIKSIASVVMAAIIPLSVYGCGTQNEVHSVAISEQSGFLKPGDMKDDIISQNYWDTVSHNFAKGTGGYYYMSGHGSFLTFYDESLGESYYVCNKPNCNHDNIECNAFVGKSIGKENAKIYYTIDTVYYYDNYLYLLDNEGYLVRFSPDGTERKRICMIDNYNYDGSTGTNLVFYKNYVYVYNMNQHLGFNKEYTENVIRYDLDGREKTVVLEYTDTNSAIWNVKINGSQMFFLIRTDKIDPDTKEVDIKCKGLYMYDMDSGKMGKVIDDEVYDYSLNYSDNGIYYYVKGKGLYFYDIPEDKSAMIYMATDEEQYAYISSDSKNIYISNKIWASLAKKSGISIDPKIKILNKNGKECASVDCKDISAVFWGDSYIFGYGKKQNDKDTGYRIISKSDDANDFKWEQLR